MKTLVKLPYILGLSTLFVTSISCEEKKTAPQTKTVVKTGFKQFHNYKVKPLNDANLQRIKHWKEFKDLQEFLAVYNKISAREALDNALELKSLTKIAKDSNRIDALQTRAFKARINVFENEVLRLVDMTYIPAISSGEVNKQISAVVNTYNSMASKIEHTYKKQDLDKTVKLDSVFNRMQ